jgi:hypothetical protein
MKILLLIAIMMILPRQISAGPAACVAAVTTCCAAEYFYIPFYIPVCILDAMCCPPMIPPTNPADYGCCILGSGAFLLPTP